MNTYNNNSSANNAASGKKFKPYRNRPGKRQGLLELFSFLLLVASAPLFLGGAFSIFLAIATFCLGIIGLFAWTRRHARFFVLLAIAVIAAAIVNIILRATFNAQCVPFFEYRNNFANANGAGVAGVVNTNNNTAANNTAAAVPAAVPTNSTNNGTTFAGRSVSGLPDGTIILVNGVTYVAGFNDTLLNGTNNSTNNGAFVGGASINGNRNDYDNSIWCGNNYIAYIVSAIVIGLAIPALLFALAALKPRNKTPVAARTTETSTTQTRTTEAY